MKRFAIRARWTKSTILALWVVAAVCGLGHAQEWTPKRPKKPAAAGRRVSYNEPAAPQKLPALTDPRSGSAFVPTWQRHPNEQVVMEEPEPYVAPVAHRALVPQAPPEETLPMDEMGEMGEVFVGEGEVVEPGMMEPIPEESMEFQTGELGWQPVAEGGCESCGGDCGLECAGECGDGCGHGQYCDGICIPRDWIDETSLFVGAHGFKGPLDMGRNGNFGFHEGVNFAGHFGRRLGLGPLGLGYQVGAQFVHSNFSGDTVIDIEENTRDQKFITAGFFRRAPQGRGVQYGAVFDYMNDNYYIDITLTQIRAEMSYLTHCGHEIGFWGAFGSRGDSDFINGSLQSFESTDLYALFYRRNLPAGGQGRVWVGATSNSDTLFGADFRVPLSNRWDFNGAVNYLAPEQGGGVFGAAEESWGIGMNLAWYPGRRQGGLHNGPFRALFNVADNTMFMVDRAD